MPIGTCRTSAIASYFFTASFAAFTCDDGYADNFTHALPVMERHNAPFAVFVTTGMMTGEIDAWLFGLSRLIATQDSIALAGKRFDCTDRNARPPRAPQRQAG